mmetsp:Transcript_64169/g.88765  ORF Transcript_64169/g.88765 Transcript_64169/m.88765 type:complete len:351 (+) Transcript_64169:678-1730(+)
MMHPWHALRCSEVHVGPTAKSEEETCDTVLHLGSVDDNNAKDHAQARQEVQEERLCRCHANRGAGEDGIVGQLLRDLVQGCAQGDAPAKAGAATLERRADEEAVAKVVEEVADYHSSNHAGPAVDVHQSLLLVRRARLHDIVGLLLCRRLLGLQHPCARDRDHAWEQEPCEHHRPPAPEHINFLLPTLRNEVCGLEQEQKECARKESACGEGGKDALEHGAVGLGEPRDARRKQDQANQRDRADNGCRAQGGGPIGTFGGFFFSLWELGQRLHVLAAAVLQVVGGILELRRHVLCEEGHGGHAARVDRVERLPQVRVETQLVACVLRGGDHATRFEGSASLLHRVLSLLL